jgi:alanine dehydrogenase
MHSGGEGLLLGGVPGVPPGRVVVLGGGVVGTQAAKVAVGLGAEVTILDKSLSRLRELDDLFSGRVRTCYSTADALEAEATQADALIGAVLVPGATAPKLVTRELLRLMKPGSVLVDVAIDQGGCAETSRPTTHADPTYIEEGVVHYCVANMPGAVPRTSTRALNNATLPIGLALAEKGLAALEDEHIAAGLNTHRGALTNRAVADSLDLEWAPFSTASAG